MHDFFASLCSSWNFDHCDIFIHMHAYVVNRVPFNTLFFSRMKNYSLLILYFCVGILGPVEGRNWEKDKREEKLMKRPPLGIHHLGHEFQGGGTAKVGSTLVAKFQRFLSLKCLKIFLKFKFKSKVKKGKKTRMLVEQEIKERNSKERKQGK